MNWINFNGDLITETSLALKPNNRGFLYGDGVFETIKYFERKVYFLEDHFTRLQKALKAVGLKLPERFSMTSLDTYAKDLCNENKQERARIKLIVWRNPGGLFQAESTECSFLMTTSEWRETPDIKLRAIFSQQAHSVFSSISRFKTLSALPYVLAGIELRQSGANEIILTDPEGHISECLTSNIFWIKNKTLFTPSLQSGCIEGVFRKNLISECLKKEISVQEGLFKRSDLMTASTVFTTNITGIKLLKSIEGNNFNTDTQKLRTLLPSGILE